MERASFAIGEGRGYNILSNYRGLPFEVSVAINVYLHYPKKHSFGSLLRCQSVGISQRELSSMPYC